MGDVVELMPHIRLRDYKQFWQDALDGKPGSVTRLRTLMAIDEGFRDYCRAMYAEHVAAQRERYAGEDDGA